MVEKETDLYEPVATWFSQSGHQVMAEVKTCDVVTLHDDQLTIVELKLKPSLKFIYQLATRTRYANFVYAALPFDSVSGTNRKHWIQLLRKLGIGLLWIRVSNLGYAVKEALRAKPQTIGGAKDKRIRHGIINEAKTRRSTLALGGQSTFVPLVTAYREDVLLTLALLQKHGPLSPKALRALGAPERVGRILLSNHDGWFERISRGTYGHLPTACEDAASRFAEAWQATVLLADNQ